MAQWIRRRAGSRFESTLASLLGINCRFRQSIIIIIIINIIIVIKIIMEICKTPTAAVQSAEKA